MEIRYKTEKLTQERLTVGIKEKEDVIDKLKQKQEETFLKYTESVREMSIQKANIRDLKDEL